METRYNLMDLHKRLTRIGEHQAARKILRLLIHGSIVLGYSDTDWQVQLLLEDAGVPVMSRSNGWATARIA
jgi:hypothetical protein